jgi:hypothetical protein
MMQTWIATLPVRPVTKRLIQCFVLDLPLPTAVMVDFGVDSLDHYRALKAVLFSDDVAETLSDEAADAALRQRIEALDKALGNGAKLNALVQTYAPQYADRVEFSFLLM